MSRSNGVLIESNYPLNKVNSRNERLRKLDFSISKSAKSLNRFGSSSNISRSEIFKKDETSAKPNVDFYLGNFLISPDVSIIIYQIFYLNRKEKFKNPA